MSQRALYAAFDLFPSAKGAATHIYQFASTLFDHFEGGQLFVLGNDKLPIYQREDGNIEVHRFKRPIPNYLIRAQAFAAELKRHLTQLPDLELVHFRDIWGAVAALQPERRYKTLFEVNGLPSIELPYRYPDLSAETLRKIHLIEQYALEKADQILVPSEVIRQNLVARAIPAKKIALIRNGAELDVTPPETLPAVPEHYILYLGALQSWQGITDLFKAFAGLADKSELQLVICSSNRPKQAKAYRKLAEKMGIAERMHWEFQLPKGELAHWVKRAQLTVAPLTECSRNLEQGCSPLKVLESMAQGTTVVASDLPVTRELVTDNANGKLVRPGRPALLSRAIRFLLDYPEENMRLGKAGREHILERFQWEFQRNKLANLYADLSA